MGKTWRRALLVLAAALYGLACFFCQSAKKEADLTYLALSQNIGSARAGEIWAREQELPEPVGFCFWGEVPGQWVSCRETDGMAQVTLVCLSGNTELAGAGALAWQAGCLIDEGTAQALFGTSLCGGQTLWKGDAVYQVLGTLPGDRPAMVTIAKEADGMVLNRCILAVPAERGGQSASGFLMRWGLQGNRVDFYHLWVLCYDLLLLTPGIFLTAVLVDCANRIRGIVSEYGVSFSLLSALGKPMLLFLTAGCLLAFLGSRAQIPKDMIPSRWSDFSFWGNWLDRQKENFRLVMLTPMGNTHLQMMLDMVKSMVSTTASGFLALCIIRRRPHADFDDRR